MKNSINYRFGEIREISKNVEQTRTIQFVMSAGTRDRHGTVLNPNKWNLKNYNKNTIVGYQHEVYGGFLFDSNPDNVIGSGRAFVEDNRLIGEVKFEPQEINPLAEKIFRKILHGTLRAASVGFLPIGKGKWGEDDEARDGKNPTYYYESQELLEWSIVNIPSHPKALKRKLSDQLQSALKLHSPDIDINNTTIGDFIKSLDSDEISQDKENGENVKIQLEADERERSIKLLKVLG